MGNKMEFPQHIKKQVREASAFKCCFCHESTAVKIHHIDPSKGDTFDSAAPLCARCHDLYGNDPNKRAMIRQARDFWYNHIKNTYGSSLGGVELLKKIGNKIDKMDSKMDILAELEPLITKIDSTLSDLKIYAKEEDLTKVRGALSTISGATSTATTATDIISADTKPDNPIPYAIDAEGNSFFLKFYCPYCNTLVNDNIATDGGFCPNCGNIIK